MALGVIELLDRAHQADIALLHQIHHCQAIRGVLFSYRNDQPQVGLNQVLPGLAAARDLLFHHKALLPGLVLLALETGAGAVAGFHLFGEDDLLLG